MKNIILYLNQRLAILGYFNEILCICERIEREGKIYPAQYNTNNEYKQIELDKFGSICYWRKNGDITYNSQANETGIGIQYEGKIPLKFVGFIKKQDNVNDQYFSDSICSSVISNLTINNSSLKQLLKAKKVSFSAIKTNTDSRSVAKDEYDGIDFEPRYSYAYFSIDFEISFTTNSQCYIDICNDGPFQFPALPIAKTFCEKVLECLNITGSIQDISFTGAIDGSNNVFVLAEPPQQVFYNGQLLKLGEGYTISGLTVTTTLTPFVGEILEFTKIVITA